MTFATPIPIPIPLASLTRATRSHQSTMPSMASSSPGRASNMPGLRRRFSNEILVEIIKRGAPENPRGFLDVGDPQAKTLFAWTLVCKDFYPLAADLVRKHCVYLDSAARVTQFLRCVTFSPPPFVQEAYEDGKSFQGLRSCPNMFVRPFPLESRGPAVTQYITNDTPMNEDQSEPLAPVMSQRLYSRFHRPVDDEGERSAVINPANRAYCGFYHSSSGREGYNLIIAFSLARLLNVCADSLYRLVLDIPLRYVVFARDGSRPPTIRKLITDALGSLRRLVNFVIIQDEEYFDSIPKWTVTQDLREWNEVWSRLRPLMYYNPLPHREADIWMDMTHIQNIELAVFLSDSRRDASGIEGRQAKTLWLNRSDTAFASHAAADPEDEPEPLAGAVNRNLTLVSIDVCKNVAARKHHLGWQTLDRENQVHAMSVRRTELPNSSDPKTPFMSYVPIEGRNYFWPPPVMNASMPLASALVATDQANRENTQYMAWKVNEEYYPTNW